MPNVRVQGKREPHMGPQRSAHWIRERAVPAAQVAVPPGAVSFTSPADLVTKLAANPSGTHFVAANSMTWTTGVSTDGSKVTDIWLPSGIVLDGTGADITALTLNANASVHGGEWKNFGTTGENGNAIFARGGPPPYPGPVLIEDVTAHDCRNRAVALATDNVTMRRTLLHTNGRYGWEALIPEPGFNPRVNVRIENCQWHGNNTRVLNPNGAAGGNKVTDTDAVYVGRCWGWGNHGSGLWTDFAQEQHILEENVFEDNFSWGIFYEVGDGNQSSGGGLASAIIRHNFLKDNAIDTESWFNAVQLLASCSDGLANGGTGFEVHNNLIDGSVLAIGFVDHDSHPTDAKGMHVHDNDVWLRGASLGRVGGSKDGTFDPFAPSAGNTYRSNRYHVTDAGAAKWRWDNANKTWAQWQALGHDLDGVLLVDA